MPETFNDPFDFQLDFSTQFDPRSLSRALDLFKKFLTNPTLKMEGKTRAIKAIRLLRDNFYSGHYSLEKALYTYEEYARKTIEGWQKVVSSHSANLQEIQRNQLVLCTTKEAHSILMWSHYSDGHRGGFLVFQPDNKGRWGERNKVLYSREIPKIWDTAKMDRAIIGQESISLLPNSEIVRKAILTKSLDWKYENEERFIRKNELGVDQELAPFKPNELKSVVFGCKFNLENARELSLHYGKVYPHTSFYFCKKKINHFGLEFVRLMR